MEEPRPRPSEAEIADERRRLRWLGILADMTLGVIYQQPGLTVADAMQLVRNTRHAMLSMFPGKERAYDLIYRPRFDRAIAERFGQCFE